MRRSAIRLAALGVGLALLAPTVLGTARPALAEGATPGPGGPFWAPPGQGTEPRPAPSRIQPDGLPAVTQAEVIGRAQAWLTARDRGPVPYSVSRTFQGYRSDCSGYVSMAFGFTMPGFVSYNMAEPSVSTPIGRDDLVQADLLINPGLGTDGHVVIFDHWADPGHKHYFGYEQSGDGGTHYREIPYPYFDGYRMSPYRYNHLIVGPVSYLKGDYDGDGKTDQALYRPATSTWYIRNSSNQSITTSVWGVAGDIPVPGDYDGDGRTDQALFRPSTGTWYIRNSSNATTTMLPWGKAGDVPATGDYDGDGNTDQALYRRSTGTWYIRNSSDLSVSVTAWGTSADIPVTGDYDADGITDQALFRPSTGTWYIRNSSSPVWTTFAWGNPGDIPATGDYDGDGKTDQALYRPGTNTWYIRNSSNQSITASVWGRPGDIPVTGDYDGDGRTDQALYRPTTGTWYTRNSSDSSATMLPWGEYGDLPGV